VAQRPARVGIGLAVRNGETTLKQTVQSILKQTYGDFRLIVSDNASTDGTEEICRSVAAHDERVLYLRQAGNLGPAANFNAAEQAAGGELFKWAAADDLYEPTYLEACVHALDEDPDAVLAYPRTRIIGPGNEWLRDYEYEAEVTDPRPSVRFRKYLLVEQRRHLGAEIFGLIRHRALCSVGPMGAFARADHVLCAGLTLMGTFRLVPEFLFLNRDHPGRSLRTTPSRAFRGRSFSVSELGSGPIPAADWWDPSKQGKIVWPEWRLFREYAAVVNRVPLSSAERRSCRATVAGVAARHGHKLARDVLINSELELRTRRLITPPPDE